MKKLLLALMLVAGSGAADEAPPAAPAAVNEDIFRDVAKELRCPTCTGLSVLDSEASFSVQIKSQVREQMAAGKSRDEILAYFTARYGPWILREPPKQGFNSLAWYVPIGLLLGGPVAIWFFVWRRRVETPTYGVRRAEDIIAEMEQAIKLARGSSGKV